MFPYRVPNTRWILYSKVLKFLNRRSYEVHKNNSTMLIKYIGVIESAFNTVALGKLSKQLKTYNISGQNVEKEFMHQKLLIMINITYIVVWVTNGEKDMRRFTNLHSRMFVLLYTMQPVYFLSNDVPPQKIPVQFCICVRTRKEKLDRRCIKSTRILSWFNS